MRIEFGNKKERKNCHGFIKALKEVEKHHSKDAERPIFLTINATDLRLAPYASDPHHSHVEATCQVVIKADSFAKQGDDSEQGRVFKFKGFKMLRAFRKNESKIVLIELQIGPDYMNICYETENQQMICYLKVECEQVDTKWPQSLESTSQNNYQLIQIGKVAQKELSVLSYGQGKDNLWLELGQQAIFFRTVFKGQFRHESKMIMNNATGFNYNTLKAKLKSKVFINLVGHFILDFLHEVCKKKKTGQLFIKIIWDPYVQNTIRHSYIIGKLQTDLGYITKAIECLLSDQMNNKEEKGVRQQVVREDRGRQLSLLKKEEGVIDVRRNIILNANELNEDRKDVRLAFAESRHAHKIEEEQTITRRLQGKF